MSDYESVKLVGGPADGQTVMVFSGANRVYVPVVDPTTWSCVDAVYVRSSTDVFSVKDVKRWNLT